MKIKQLFLLLTILFGIFFTCCDEEKEFGENYIYMPQATTTGGINALYQVPSGGGELTYNFKTQNGKINIMLGAMLSGNFSGDNFSVNIDVLDNVTDDLIESGAVENAKPLPEAIYTLPPQISIRDSNQATFYLSVDSVALIDNPAYSGRNLILTVGLSKPTKYELASKNTYTNVVIDVDALRKLLQQ